MEVGLKLVAWVALELVQVLEWVLDLELWRIVFVVLLAGRLGVSAGLRVVAVCCSFGMAPFLELQRLSAQCLRHLAGRTHVHCQLGEPWV